MVECKSIQLRYSDGYQAHARLWLPADPRGALLYLHGIQSHGGWFETSAGRLAEAGWAVLLPDRRGSGLNRQDRGHTPSADRLVRDAAECCDEIKARTGRERFHLLGVSWGGKVVLALCAQAPHRVEQVTLVAPGLFPKVDVPRSQKVRIAASAFLGGYGLFDIPLQQAELFTENPARQEFIRNDPLALRQVTGRFLICSRKMDGLAQGVRHIEHGPPLRLFLAGQDRIIDNAKTRDFVRKLTWPDRQIFEYPDAHHTLEFESAPEPFLSDLVAGSCA